MQSRVGALILNKQRQPTHLFISARISISVRIHTHTLTPSPIQQAAFRYVTISTNKHHRQAALKNLVPKICDIDYPNYINYNTKRNILASYFRLSLVIQVNEWKYLDMKLIDAHSSMWKMNGHRLNCEGTRRPLNM